MKTKDLKEKEFIQTHQRTVWLELSPRQRLRRSWALRRRIKNLEEAHDKKIFPRP